MYCTEKWITPLVHADERAFLGTMYDVASRDMQAGKGIDHTPTKWRELLLAISQLIWHQIPFCYTSPSRHRRVNKGRSIALLLTLLAFFIERSQTGKTWRSITCPEFRNSARVTKWIREGGRTFIGRLRDGGERERERERETESWRKHR